MKKVICAMALVVAFASCNNEGGSSDNLQDSVMETIDSMADQRIDSIQETTDSVKQRLENTFEKTDSANAATADSAAAKQ